MNAFITRLTGLIKPVCIGNIQFALDNHLDKTENDFIAHFSQIENRISDLEYASSIVKSALCILSGKVMLRTKELVGHGSWSTTAHEMFPITEHERNIRMQAASIADIEHYLHLGWKRISILARACKKIKVTIPFEYIVENIDYQIDPYDPNDVEHFYNLVTAYVAWIELKNHSKHKVKLMKIVDAVERGIVFDDKLLNKLKKDANPTTTLTNMIDFDTANIKAPTIPDDTDIRKRRLSVALHEVKYIGELITDFNDIHIKSVPLNLLEEANSTINKLITFKEMGKMVNI